MSGVPLRPVPVPGTVTKLCPPRAGRRRSTDMRPNACDADAMGRDPRIQVPGVVYHVGAKGNRGGPLFNDDYDRRVFLTHLGKQARRHDWVVLTYVLMTNHYHLLVKLRASSLSAGMCGLNGEF